MRKKITEKLYERINNSPESFIEAISVLAALSLLPVLVIIILLVLVPYLLVSLGAIVGAIWTAYALNGLRIIIRGARDTSLR